MRPWRDATIISGESARGGHATGARARLRRPRTHKHRHAHARMHARSASVLLNGLIIAKVFMSRQQLDKRFPALCHRHVAHFTAAAAQCAAPAHQGSSEDMNAVCASFQWYETRTISSSSLPAPHATPAPHAPTRTSPRSQPSAHPHAGGSVGQFLLFVVEREKKRPSRITPRGHAQRKTSGRARASARRAADERHRAATPRAPHPPTGHHRHHKTHTHTRTHAAAGAVALGVAR